MVCAGGVNPLQEASSSSDATRKRQRRIKVRTILPRGISLLAILPRTNMAGKVREARSNFCTPNFQDKDFLFKGRRCVEFHQEINSPLRIMSFSPECYKVKESALMVTYVRNLICENVLSLKDEWSIFILIYKIK